MRATVAPPETVPLTREEVDEALAEGGPKAMWLQALLTIGEVLQPIGLESVDDAAVRQRDAENQTVRMVARALLAHEPIAQRVIHALLLVAERETARRT